MGGRQEGKPWSNPVLGTRKGEGGGLSLSSGGSAQFPQTGLAKVGYPLAELLRVLLLS